MPGERGVNDSRETCNDRRMARAPRKPPATPTEPALHDAALSHLARYATTRAGLLRVLDRKVARWAASEGGDSAATSEARAAARRVVARLTESGAVSDTVFAQARARTLHRAGKSARAIGAHLSSKGVGSALAAESARQDPERELAAAVIHVRKRRLGAYRLAPSLPETYRRELGSLARAGFSQPVASQALRMSREDAEALIVAFRAEL
jgi:regulatory protein